MIFKDKLLGFVNPLVLSVDALALVLALSKRSDIKIVAEHSLYRHNRPRILALPNDRLAAFRLSRGFGTSGRRYAVVGQIIRNPLVAPARRIQFKNLSDNLRCRRVDFIRHQLVVLHDIPIRHGTDPASVLLSPGNDAFDLLRGICDRHFIEQKTQADVCPIVMRRIIDAVPDGYDPHARVPQILQLNQTTRIASGESAQILDDEDIVLSHHQIRAHPLIILPLLKRIARTVSIHKEGQLAVRKIPLNIVGNDVLLVFDARVIPIRFHIHGNPAITRDTMRLFNSCFHIKISLPRMSLLL